jgi:hypothetical protein
VRKKKVKLPEKLLGREKNMILKLFKKWGVKGAKLDIKTIINI